MGPTGGSLDEGPNATCRRFILDRILRHLAGGVFQ
jgi:hypothetical protein